MTLTLSRTTTGYWINDPTGEILDGPCGPYTSKAEADEDLRGLERFHKYGDKPGFVSCDSAKKQKP